MPTIYEQFNVQPIINAAGSMTRLGGALMPPEVIEAMAQAAEYCVRIEELQMQAGDYIAQVTGAEAGYVTCGAAAGLMLGAAACVAGLDIGKMERLPDTSGLKNEVIVQRPHRNSYDHALRAVGVRLVEVGWLGHAMPRPVESWEIEAAINERTAAIYWPVMDNAAIVVGLAETVAAAHKHNVPVIVDAAAGLPPTAGLRSFIEAGADLVAFSGGKALRGPQASGILAGRRDLIQSVALQNQDMDVYSATWSLRGQLLETGRLPGPPLQGIGRTLKVGKEEIIGLLTALRLFIERDEAAEQAGWLAKVQIIVDGMAGLPGVEAKVITPPHRVIPLARVVWDENELQLSGPELVNALADSQPPICVAGDGRGGIVSFNPFSLREDDPELIVARLRDILSRHR